MRNGREAVVPNKQTGIPKNGGARRQALPEQNESFSIGFQLSQFAVFENIAFKVSFTQILNFREKSLAPLRLNIRQLNGVA